MFVGLNIFQYNLYYEILETPKYACSIDVDTVNVTLHTNLITYPIGNSPGNSMAPFLNFQNFAIWTYDVIITSKMAIASPFSPQIAHLSTFDPITATFYTDVIVYTIGNLSENPMALFSNSQNDLILRYDVKMASKWSLLALFTTNRTFDLCIL